MPKILYCALFIALTAMLACSGPETSSFPTAADPVPTLVPADTPEPTEAPAPTNTPVLNAMPEPTDTPSEMLDPINMNDPGTFMSQLSSAEQSCISETGGPGQVLTLVNSPDQVPPQKAQELVQCLGDETLLRLFLTGLIDQTGPLSMETSTCIRHGFQDLDVGAVLLSSSMGPGGEEAAMTGSMAGFVLTLSCLNEEEWQIASPTLDLTPNDRESLQCVTSKLGGPEGIAAALQPKDGEPPRAYIDAAMECGLRMDDPPGAGMPGPAGMNDTRLLMSDLSSAELSCLSEIGDPQQLLMLMNSPEPASPQERDALVGCLEHETLLKIFLKGFTDQTGPLSDETSACVSARFENFDLRAMMFPSPEESDEGAAMVQGMAGFLITLSCLNEEEWQAAGAALDANPGDREALQCVMNKLGGPEGIAASLESKEGEPPLDFFNAAAECGMQGVQQPPG